MAKYYKYIIFAVGALLAGVVAWYFQSIISYILISAVLSLIGAPVVKFLGKPHIRNYRLPKWLCATITLVLLGFTFFLFFRIFVPLVANEAQKLSQLNPDVFVNALKGPVSEIDAFVNRFGLNNGKPFSTMELVTQKIQSVLNYGLFTDFMGSIATTIGTLFTALFSISFMTFFFLKDEGLFNGGVLMFVAPKYEEATVAFLTSTKNLLVRYFIGIGTQSLGVIILTAIGLWIVGIDLQTGLVISLFAGIINVIPYIGPLIATIFAMVLGLTSEIQTISPSEISHLLTGIGIVFLVVRVIDNFIFQTFIFSNSVKAHPLEIFLVILIAGHIAGITGMLVAIPGYTVMRVFAKQFLNNFAVVKKLTEKI